MQDSSVSSAVQAAPPADPQVTPEWDVISSPNASGNNFLNAVTAVAPTDIWAVGYHQQTGSPQQTLIEHYNGTSWIIVTSPNIGSGDNQLSGVIAVSANSVWAVGSYVNTSTHFQSLILHWDGNTWSQASSPNPGADQVLYAVTAISWNDLWAVGNYIPNGFSVYRTLTVHYTGGTWSNISSPNQQFNAYNYLRAVAGSGSNDVWAVGDWSRVPFTMHWDGTQWSIVSYTYQPGQYILHGVTAIASNDAWAVGVRSYQQHDTPIAIHWNGSAWVDTQSPNDPTLHELQAVANLGSNDVWAVASDAASASLASQHWDGSTWHLVATPQFTGGILPGVVELAADNVWAVGYYPIQFGYQTLILHYPAGPLPPAPTCDPNSYWCTDISPNGSGTNILNAVAAVGQNPTQLRTPAPDPYRVMNLWAVGGENVTTQGGTSLIERWNPQTQAWTKVNNVPNVGTLNGIAVIPGAYNTEWDAFAVGDAGILRYTGSTGTWTVSANQGAKAVVVRNASEAWAVGDNLVWAWDGSSWSVAYTGNSDDTFTSVASFGRGQIWVVGYTSDFFGDRQPLALRNDSNGWHLVSIPDPGSTLDAYLQAVDLFNDSYVWAVGSYYSNGVYHSLIEQWDGSTWRRIAAPTNEPGTHYNQLRHVWVDGAYGVWAAGIYSNVTNTLPDWRTLILHWGDQGWDWVSSPSPGTGSQLLGIGTLAGEGAVLTTTWAVGNYLPGAQATPQTLVERIVAPQAPAYTTSYYMTNLGPSPGKSYDPYELGRKAALNHESGIIVLDFGQPRNWAVTINNAYGTLLPGSGTHAYIVNPIPGGPDITTAANAFADGYHAAHTTGSIVLALGINNFSKNSDETRNTDVTLTAGHAQAWADLVDAVYQHTLLYPEISEVVAAIDAEPNFASCKDGVIPGTHNCVNNIRSFDFPGDNSTYTWAKQYHPLVSYQSIYNFGSTDGYPGPVETVSPPAGESGWSVDQLYQISYGLHNTFALPEIYKPPYASDWHRVKRWSTDHTQLPLNFAGIISDCQAAAQKALPRANDCTQVFPNPTPGADALGALHFQNDQAQQVFWLTLNADPKTRQNMGYSTDILWTDLLP